MSTLAPSPPATEKRTSSPHSQEEANDSIISRLVIAPLTFLSFIFSLFLVDTYVTSERLQGGGSRHASGRVKQALSAVLWKPHLSSPYAYVGSPQKKDEAWVWHTKQRKMLRMEVVEAFELRRWVVIALGALTVVIGLGWLWVARWALCRWG